MANHLDQIQAAGLTKRQRIWIGVGVTVAVFLFAAAYYSALSSLLG